MNKRSVLFILCRVILSFMVIASLMSCTKEKKGHFTPRIGAASVSVEDKIYVFGGLVKKLGLPSLLDLVEEYDPQTDNWSKKAPMPSKRLGHSAVLVAGKVYILGGREDKIYETAEIFDPTSNKWISKKVELTPRWQHMAVSIRDKIYIFGGIVGTGKNRNLTGAVEVYDPATETVTIKSSMPEPVSGAGLCLLKGKVYIMGGKRGVGEEGFASDVVQVYGPSTDNWETIQPMNIPRVSHAAVAINEKIYVIGGSSAGEVLNSIEYFDPEKGNWELAKFSLKKPRACHVAILIKDNLYVIGGSAKDDPSGFLSDMEVIKP